MANVAYAGGCLPCEGPPLGSRVSSCLGARQPRQEAGNEDPLTPKAGRPWEQFGRQPAVEFTHSPVRVRCGLSLR